MFIAVKVEIARAQYPSAQRALDQALSADFSIRSAPKFRLVKALLMHQQLQGQFQVQPQLPTQSAVPFQPPVPLSTQQGGAAEALEEMAQVLSLPEFQQHLHLTLHTNAGDANNNRTQIGDDDFANQHRYTCV